MNKNTNTKIVFGTKEWADENVNIQNGCPNDCRYCYAKAMAVQYKRETRDSWKEPTLRVAAIKKVYKKRPGTIMFPSTHDITKENIEECIGVLKKMLEAGNQILIVSKPDPDCIEKMCTELEEYKDQILFRFTIGSADDEILQFWEPSAPAFEDRVNALTTAYEMGFQTSVSSEPMLDNQIEDVVSVVAPFITDAIWIGLPNRLKQRVSVNCGDETSEMCAEELMGFFSEERVMALYETYKDDPMVKWKESIKDIVGIDRSTTAGLDI